MGISEIVTGAADAGQRWSRGIHDPALFFATLATIPVIGPAWWFVPMQHFRDLAGYAWLVLLLCGIYSWATGTRLLMPQRLSEATQMILWGRQRPETSETWTGQPTSGAVRVAPAQRAVPLDRLFEALRERIIGQDHVLDAVVKGLQRREAGLDAKTKPFSIIAAGPTGVGKTEIAKTLADLEARPLVRLDMNNYHSEYTASALVGATPGYFGSDRPGRLAADIAAAPQAVVLFDEVEKAHQNVLNVLLQMLDEGYVRELSMGMTADARQTVVVLTTNLLQHADHADDPARTRQALVGAGMRPELANRVSVVALFKPFAPETVAQIAEKTISDYLRSWARTEGLQVQVSLDAAVIDAVVARADARFGARDIRRGVEDTVGQALVQAYLPHRKARHKPTAAEVTMDGDELRVVLT